MHDSKEVFMADNYILGCIELLQSSVSEIMLVGSEGKGHQYFGR